MLADPVGLTTICSGSLSNLARSRTGGIENNMSFLDIGPVC